MKTLEFAQYELHRYAAQMGINPKITFSVEVSAFDTSRFFRFDAKYDDAFSIDVKNGKGTIVATNERSVLLGAYHFLKRQGCRFIHPWEGGEYIPLKDAVLDVDETWYAAKRHRGMNDGSDFGEWQNLDILLRFVDWLPKMMANSFFTELTDYYSHFQRICTYPDNPYREPDDLSREQFLVYDKMLIEALKTRGLLRHGAGHGWTTELMGVESQRLESDEECLRPEILATTNGEKKFFNKKPLFTNLCYSQEAVRKEFAGRVYQYSVEHPEVDFIHVWLADYFGNFCECEECSKLTPTDWYVKLLNDIDDIFTQHGSDKKIVFLAYFELAYPPIQERLHNSDRFVLMFAPYGRDFSKRYGEEPPKPYTPARNNTYTWSDMDMGLYYSQLRDWKKQFDGDSFVFDYTFVFHECAFYHVEASQVGYAKTAYDDNVYLDKLKLNGRVECANIRTLTPTAFTYHVYFSSLFYGDALSYDEVMQEFFEGCYGIGEPISEFLQTTNKLMPQEYIRDEFKGCGRPMTEAERANLQKSVECTRAFKKELFTYVPQSMVHRTNCFYFREYLDLLEGIQTAMLKKGDENSVERKEELWRLFFRTEGKMPGLFDASVWYYHWKRFF